MSGEEFDMFDDDGETSEHTYLTFRVGEQEYAVPVGVVTEIVRVPRIYSVPDVPSYIRGVINLRGKVIPLLDVRSRFGMARTELDDRTVVVVLQVDDVFTGLVVDAVSEVVELPPDQVDEHGARGGVRQNMVNRVGRRGDRVSFILDITNLLAHVAVSAPLAQAA